MKYNKKILDRFINEKVAIATKTQEEFGGFMELLEKETNLMWNEIDLPTEFRGSWNIYRQRTVIVNNFYNTNVIGYGPEGYLKEHGYEIIEYQNLIKGDYMKTNEFIERVEALGYGIVNLNNRDVRVFHKNQTVAYIDKKEIHQLETIITQELFDLLVEYARTPIDEREEEPKYYWKAKGLGPLMAESQKYLNYVEGVTPLLYTKEEVDEFKTKFTKKEFKEICEKYNITAEFEKEEIGKEK